VGLGGDLDHVLAVRARRDRERRLDQLLTRGRAWTWPRAAASAQWRREMQTRLHELPPADPSEEVGCTLRVSGPCALVAAAVGDSEMKFKESVFAARKRKSEQDETTFNCQVSEADNDDVPVQIDEAVAFLAAHRAELAKLLSREGVEHAMLDFGWDFPEGKLGQWNRFPIELIRRCAELGIELEVSIYGTLPQAMKDGEIPRPRTDPTQALIGNAELVTGIFGRWPSFHDAEVLRVTLDRSGTEAPTLEAVVHVFHMTDEVGPGGFFVLENHTLVTLRFLGVELEEITGLNRQNVLQQMKISPIDPARHRGRGLSVKMNSSYGLDASFECTRCEVTDARPYVKPS
jgi:hypothetical protein